NLQGCIREFFVAGQGVRKRPLFARLFCACQTRSVLTGLFVKVRRNRWRTDGGLASVTARRFGARITRGWRQSDLNQREYCEAQELSLKAFGNWRAKFKTEPQPLPRRVLYPGGGGKHKLSSNPYHRLL